LAALVAASIVVGQLLRLGPHLVEVPISAMLVLGVGYAAGAESTGYGRVIETVIGAVVGVLVNVLFPPPVQSRHAGQAVARLAEESAALLEEAATQLPTGPATEQTARWLEDARRLNRHVPRVDRALTHAEDSRRLNVRALGAPRSTRSLRGGLESLELCSVATRTLFRSVHDWVRAGMPEPDEHYIRQARSAWRNSSPSWPSSSGPSVSCSGSRSRAPRRLTVVFRRLGGEVAGVDEPAGGVLGGDRGQGHSDGRVQRRSGACCGGLDQGLDQAGGLLDRRQVRRVGRQEQ
jgi:hypothetical protein